jgi:hypothetical protein
MMSLFVTMDAPETRETLANFFRESFIILHCQKDIIVHRLNVNSLERV